MRIVRLPKTKKKWNVARPSKSLSTPDLMEWNANAACLMFVKFTFIFVSQKYLFFRYDVLNIVNDVSRWFSYF